MSFAWIKRTVCLILALVVLIAGLLFTVITLYPIRYTDIIKEMSIKYDLPLEIVFAVIHTESRFRPEVRSHASAAGLMQLMPATAAWAAENVGMSDYNEERITEPRVNIELGCWYLNWLYGQFEAQDTVFAAYNAGNGRVSGWLRDDRYSSDGITLEHIPFPETRNYVQRVNAAMPVYRMLLTIFGRFLS